MFGDRLDNERVFNELVISNDLIVDEGLLHGSPFLSSGNKLHVQSTMTAEPQQAGSAAWLYGDECAPR
jgi:hypothetical protein